MIKILIIGLITLILVGNAQAGWDGNGASGYPNTGYATAHSTHSDGVGAASYVNTPYYNTGGNTIYYKFSGSASVSDGYIAWARRCTWTGTGCSNMAVADAGGAHSDSGTSEYVTSTNMIGQAVTNTLVEDDTACAYVVMYASPNIIATYNVSGDTCGVTWVKLYLGDAMIFKTDLDVGGDSYNMEIIDNIEYKIVFSNAHEYIFTCSGEETYDYDLCAYMSIYLRDYCGNRMTNTSVDIYKSDGGCMETYEFVGTFLRENPIEILLGIDIEIGKMLDIYMDTDMGTYHVIDYCEDKTIDILHPSKYWTMAYGAFDIDTRAPISGVRVTANQTCVINPDHPLKQYLFTGANGYGTFIGLSGDRIDVRMGHPDYYGNEDSNFFVNIPCDAFQTAYSIDTYLNKSSSGFVDENQTENLTEGCSVWFQDQTGKRDRHINDTDTYVDMYYKNTNCTATLKFQRLYSTYWMSKMSFNIPALETGYKRIYNVNFSEADANYRGYMYASECECNSTRSLYVSNTTIEEEQHYQNLTAHCRFKHQMGGGQVDYRSDVEILTYAYSNTSHTLLNINLTLYEQTTQIATKQCDWSDFAGASPKWFYTWSPDVNYETDKNYTVIMTGYNGLHLDADDVWTSNIRNNKLTVHVKDNHDTPVSHSTLFVQGWGSHALEDTSTFTVSGLQDQVYQYKATKSGYTSSGWASINFTGTDQTVTCVLIQQATESITGYKLKDSEVKSFFIPLMYMLLIMILIGGVMNAAKR